MYFDHLSLCYYSSLSSIEILLYSLLCSKLLVAYTTDNTPNALLEKFLIFHALLHEVFRGDDKRLSLILQDVDFFLLTSNKKLKSNEKAILDSLCAFEEGFDEETSARNQLREILEVCLVKKSGAFIRDVPSSHEPLTELIMKPDVIDKLDEIELNFIDGYYSSCVLLADYVKMAHEEISAHVDAEDFLTQDKVITWKEECINVRMHYLISELIEKYMKGMRSIAGPNSTGNLEELNVAHTRERNAVMSVYCKTIQSLQPSAVGMKKQLQGTIRDRKEEKIEKTKQNMKLKVKEIYNKNYHLLAKPNPEDMRFSLTDAGSPYTSLVSFKSALASHLSKCKTEISELGYEDDTALSDFLVSELKDIIGKLNIWVDGYDNLYKETSIALKEDQERYKKLKEEDILFDANFKEEQEKYNNILGELESKLTEQRIQQSSELEEKSTKLDVYADKVERATKLNDSEKTELQNSLIEIQKQIEDIQSQVFEKRTQRENQTDEIHRDMLQEEQESHGWFKAMIQRQHDLLEKELEVERKINQRRTELMEKKFNSETEQLQKLEKVREGGRESIQKYKEKRLQQREQSFKEHEQLLARYNAQINELDSKLTLTTAEEVEVRVARRASVDKRKAIDEALQQQKEKDKKCSIM